MIEGKKFEIGDNNNFRGFTSWLSSDDRFYFLEIKPTGKFYLAHYRSTAKNYGVELKFYSCMFNYEGRLIKIVCFEKEASSFRKLNHVKCSEEEIAEFKKLIELKKAGCSYKEIQEEMGYKNRTDGWNKYQYILRHRNELSAYMDIPYLEENQL